MRNALISLGVLLLLAGVASADAQVDPKVFFTPNVLWALVGVGVLDLILSKLPFVRANHVLAAIAEALLVLLKRVPIVGSVLEFVATTAPTTVPPAPEKMAIPDGPPPKAGP